jgi:hypothetical protein
MNASKVRYLSRTFSRETLLFLLATLTLTSCDEGVTNRVDRELGWHKVTPYFAERHGAEIGYVTVPNLTQRVEFFMWGIPKEDEDDDEEPRIIAECSRDLIDLKDTDSYTDLERIAVAAEEQGCDRAILSGHKAYLVEARFYGPD